MLICACVTVPFDLACVSVTWRSLVSRRLFRCAVTFCSNSFNLLARPAVALCFRRVVFHPLTPKCDTEDKQKKEEGA